MKKLKFFLLPVLVLALVMPIAFVTTGCGRSGGGGENGGNGGNGNLTSGYFYFYGTMITRLTTLGLQQQHLTIPANVTAIGWFAFMDQTGSQNVGNTTLQTVTFASGSQLTRIEDGAFMNASNLSSINLPNSLTHISQGAFAGCMNLLDITIPANVTYIGYDAFCIRNINDPSDWYGIASKNRTITMQFEQRQLENCGLSTASLSQADVKFRGGNAFANIIWQRPASPHLDFFVIDGNTITDLTSLGRRQEILIVPSNIEIIGESAFSVTWDGFQNGVQQSVARTVEFQPQSSLTEIGIRAFGGLEQLRTITIPAGVETMDDWAFNGTFNLETLSFEYGSQLRTIGRTVLAGSGLRNITIPASVQNIGGGAFSDASLETFVFEQGSQLTAIGQGAFFGQTNISSIEIPVSVTYIGEGAFTSWTQEQTIYIRRTNFVANDYWRDWTDARIVYLNTVAFNHLNDDALVSVTVRDGGTVSRPANTPIRTGHNFVDWYTQATGGIAFDFSTPITNDRTIFARWAIQTFNVSFDTLGGSSVDAQVVNWNATSTRPVIDPARQGYSFVGWYTAQTGGVEFNFSTPIIQNTTIFARWVERLGATVNFVTGTSQTFNSIIAPYGQAYGTLPTPTRDGYDFVGWFTANVGGTQVTSTTVVTNENDHNLYARWQAQRVTGHVSGGANHSIFLDGNGGLWAVGRNNVGQLGDGTTTDRSTPVQIMAGTTFVKVATANSTSFAIDNTGILWAWGQNNFGELGNGVPGTDVLTPVQIGGATRFIAVSTGNQHTVAIDSNGGLWGWGANGAGQLARPQMPVGDSAIPVRIGTTAQQSWVFTRIETNQNHNLAIRQDGTLWAWGGNMDGQIGNNGANLLQGQRTLFNVMPDTQFKDIATSQSNSFAITTDGRLFAWGRDNLLTTGQFDNQLTPIHIMQDRTFEMIRSSLDHVIALDTNGNLWGWGTNESNRLDSGMMNFVTTPIQIMQGTEIDYIVTGGNFIVVIDTNGVKHTQGSNQWNQLNFLP